MQVSINQTKKGFAIELKGELYHIIERDHVKPGKGGAFVRVKLKNIKLGTTIDRTFKPDEKVKIAYIEKKNLQFLYSSHDTYEFMDHDTYNQISLHREQLGDVAGYLKEGTEVTVLTHKDKIIALEPPIFINMKIASTEPGIRGDTSRSGTKPAKTETGMTILVPLFVNEGDIVRMDTRTGEYAGRA
ncbi:MAG: elongation factor P [Candidatus Omnitrophica bacterium]|nr:elongation factor P [Candidatus Omnitrophota bacterium]